MSISAYAPACRPGGIGMIKQQWQMTAGEEMYPL